MVILMSMNIYITKPNEKFLKTIHENKKSMSGLINKLLDDYRGPESKPKKLSANHEDTPTIKLEPLVKLTERFSGATCKIHGLPLDERGRCLQKGCKYA